MSTTPQAFELAPDGTAYQLVGEANKPLIILIHGLGLCRLLWKPYLETFSEHYRVLIYDLFGHGDSAAPDEAMSLERYARQIADLMDYVDADQAILVGFSIGGMINRRFALDYPERTQALVIMNSPHERSDEAQNLVEARAKAVRDEGAMATLESALVRWFTPDFIASHPEVIDLVRSWRKGVAARGYREAAWVLAAGVKELIKPDPPIELPSLVITSECDSGSTPAMSYAIAGEIERAEVLIIPKLQHLGLMENPLAFSQPMMAFLEKVNQWQQKQQ